MDAQELSLMVQLVCAFITRGHSPKKSVELAGETYADIVANVTVDETLGEKISPNTH